MTKWMAILMLPTLLMGQKKQVFESSDLTYFWTAYDLIVATTDTIEKQELLENLYFNPSTPGLDALLEVRRYTSKDYLDAIANYPKFWASLRAKTQSVETLYPAIESDIEKLRAAYPALKPATIYFAMGAFRTNGTVYRDRVLIGAECALADRFVVIDELPEWRQPFYRESEPRENLPLLCTHEYLHIQQKPLVENLLSMCLYEGVAEFISCLVTGKKSTVPAIDFGKAHEKEVVDLFVKDLYVMSHNYNWIWGENRNDFKIRDLGYYIGYEIAERHYAKASDKTKAIANLIELDYSDEKAVARLVDDTKLFPEALSKLNADYESRRPTVVLVEPLEGGNKLRPGKTWLKIVFSEALNGTNTGVDFGPLGESAFPVLGSQRKWSDDHKSWTIEADLAPNRHYQILISNNFRKADQTRLKPYLIDFWTSD